ncbi:MAG: TrbG/VirB9 family P-type conjugative transfer protein [Candidatus Sulfotelmatobacter sp.]
MRHLKFVVNCALVFSSIGAFAQDAARTVQYHSQDIVPIRAKVKYTTLIELPTTEKIMEAATGDKEFWIVDVVGNFCFVHPAKQGISSNLNLITDKGNIYSFTLQDISATPTSPDLKVIVEPADRSAIVAASGPPQFVPAAQLEQSRQPETLSLTSARVGNAEKLRSFSPSNKSRLFFHT